MPRGNARCICKRRLEPKQSAQKAKAIARTPGDVRKPGTRTTSYPIAPGSRHRSGPWTTANFRTYRALYHRARPGPAEPDANSIPGTGTGMLENV